ncbi:MAG: hypothetical protein KDK99_22560, partial [Verrucomicrobiales bacterium]|nr:hypothetical protein [Verrucomicrobiales bacterium]
VVGFLHADISENTLVYALYPSIEFAQLDVSESGIFLKIGEDARIGGKIEIGGKPEAVVVIGIVNSQNKGTWDLYSCEITVDSIDHRDR